MKLAGLVLLLAVVVLGVGSSILHGSFRKYDVKKHPLRLLYPIAERLLLIIKRFQKEEGRERERQQFRELYIGPEAENAGRLDQIKRTALCIVLALGMLFLATASELNQTVQQTLIRDGKLLRPTGTASSVDVVLQWKGERNQETSEPLSGEVVLTVNTKRLEGSELQQQFDKARDYIESSIQGDNNSLQELRGSLNFPEYVPETEITVTYYPKTFQWILSNGSRTSRILPEEGAKETVCVEMDYYGTKETFDCELTLLPSGNEKERFLLQLQNFLKALEEDSSKLAEFSLPEELDGVALSWETEEKAAGDFFLLGAAGIAGILISGKRTTEKKLKQREQQLLLDYPELIAKFMLLLNAGLTTRAVWERILVDYKKHHKTHYVYEEMKATLHAIENGMSEGRAYEAFGKRCRLLPYLRFGTILVQNLEKGAAGTLPLLEHEAAEAFAERKETAKRLGEEAGTKLLIPMAGMLGIVFAMILIPAFQAM